MELLPFYFTDQVLFDQISSYFNIVDLLHLSQVSRALNLIIEQKSKKILKGYNLPSIPSKAPIHQMKFYFDRCLSLYKKKDDNQEVKHDKLIQEKQEKYTYKNKNTQKISSFSLISTIQNPFKFKIITYFEVGVQFAVFMTVDNETYIFKTVSLINFKEKKSELNYQKRSNVIQIKCKSENITYMTSNGEVYQIFGEKSSEKLFQKEELLQWSLSIAVQKIEDSFNYTIFKPKNYLSYEGFLKHVYGYEINLQKLSKLPSNMPKNLSDHKQTSEQNTSLILLNNISLRYYLIQFESNEKIIQFVVGSREAYFLNDHYQCFVCYFQQDQQKGGNQNNNTQILKILKAKKFHHFFQKSIIKLASGYNFFIALERKIHDVSKWTVEEVCKWVRQIGFGPFVKIFNVQKVDGKKLLTIDKSYMHSSLGITKPNMQQKFLMLLQQVIENKKKQDTLYGWGKNENGQLGSRNAIFIKDPQKIKLPNSLLHSEYIDSIFCGWFQTFLRTQKGRIYRTLNYEKKKKTNINLNQQDESQSQIIEKTNKHLKEAKKAYFQYEQPDDFQTEFDQKKNSGKNQKLYNSKKKQKYAQDQIKKETHHKKFQEQQRWMQCDIGKGFFAQGYKDILFLIQCPSQKQFEPIKEKKLRPIKMILNKIIWSQCALQQQLYKVGYMDKDMGLIQITILELKTFDYNENRIKYIKKSNQIVWDKQNKVDSIS